MCETPEVYKIAIYRHVPDCEYTSYLIISECCNNELTHFKNFLESYPKSVMVKVTVNEILREIRDGNVRALQSLLIQDRGEVNTFNESQLTPLMVAIVEGNPKVVETLLEKGAAVSTTAFGKPSPLMLAIELRQAEIVKLLLSYNPDTTYGSKAVGGGTALSHTLHRGLYDMADLLLQNGVDINQRDKMGITALMYAALDGNYIEVEYLLNKGANMNLVCNTLMMMGKKTALLAAAMYDHVQVVRLLVDRGAELLPPHYREFLQRSEVEESEDARACSALLRKAAANSDCRNRENAVDLTGDDDVVAPSGPDPAQEGRGRGIMHAIPAWMQERNEGLIPRHVESMHDFQLFRQGALPPPKRGPLYHPNTRAASSGYTSVSSQFSDANENRRHYQAEKSSLHQPFEVDDHYNDNIHTSQIKLGSQRGGSRDGGNERASRFESAPQKKDRRSRSRSRSRDRARKWSDSDINNNGGSVENRSERAFPQQSRSHGAYEHDYYRHPYDRHGSETSQPNLRGASPDRRSDDGRYMMNNAAGTYTPKPPRPRPPPKPLLPEPVMLPDVDFVRSKGNPLPPGREVNSYAELERKRREEERTDHRNSMVNPNNNHSAPEEASGHTSRFRLAFVHNEQPTPAAPPASFPSALPSSSRHFAGEDISERNTSQSHTFTPPPPLHVNGAGRGRSATLPAWMATTVTPTSAPFTDGTDTDKFRNGRKRNRDYSNAIEADMAVTEPATKHRPMTDLRRIVPPVIPTVTPPNAPAAVRSDSLNTTMHVKCFSMSDLISAKSSAVPVIPALSWLHGYLAPAGISPQWIATCERVLVQEQGIRTRDMFAALPASYLDDAHLTTLGLTPMSVRQELRRLHARLNAVNGGSQRVLPVLESGPNERSNKGATFGTGTDVDDSESVDSSAIK